MIERLSNPRLQAGFSDSRFRYFLKVEVKGDAMRVVRSSRNLRSGAGAWRKSAYQRWLAFVDIKGLEVPGWLQWPGERFRFVTVFDARFREVATVHQDDAPADYLTLRTMIQEAWRP